MYEEVSAGLFFSVFAAKMRNLLWIMLYSDEHDNLAVYVGLLFANTFQDIIYVKYRGPGYHLKEKDWLILSLQR